MPQTSSSTSSSRRFLLRTLLPYLACMAVLVPLLDYGFTQVIALGTRTLFSYRIHRLVYVPEADEVPILGSSRAASSYAPEAISPRAFNYGIAGAGYRAVEFQIRRALAHENPSPIIVNVDYGWWYMHGHGDKANYIPSADHPDVREVMGDDYSFTHRLPLLRYFGMFDRYFRRRYDDKDLRIMTPEAFDHFVAVTKQSPPQHTPDPELLARLFALVDGHPDRTFIFVVAPYHPVYMSLANHPPGAIAWLDSLAKRPNAVVLDHGQTAYPDSLFHDPVHMNYRGALQFSRDLRAEIAELLE